MEDYKQYLAQKILTEDQVVTYRLLSRALKVHVNTAKEMLYDFHKWQNDKRPDTLHATYIIYGTRNREVHQQNGDGDGDGDGDVDMTDIHMSEDVDDRNAPFSDLVPTYTLSLVRQEQLEETLSQYEEVTSVHVYSLAPHPLKDLQLLTDAARQVFRLSTTDNAPDSGKVYGTIANPNVRRRERRAGPIPKAYVSPPKVESKPLVKQEAKPVEAVTVKEESKGSSKPTAPAAAAKKSIPASSLKRQASSGIGQMFAKAAAKPKKPAAKTSEPPTAPAVASRATETMSDDGEDDAEPIAKVKQEDTTARQARKDRQAELHRMMEESDEEEPEEAAESQEEDPMEEEPPPPEPEAEPKAEEQQAEVVSSTGGGRRRGRRRVTRKKQIMDEKGYLVTIQEQGWESFSEDEAPPPPPKPKQPRAVKAEPTTKPKKGAAKGPQGNIMSFFTKK